MNKTIFILSLFGAASLGFLAGKHQSSFDVATAPAELSAPAHAKTTSISVPLSNIPENNFHEGEVVAPQSSQISSSPSLADVASQAAQEQIDAIKAEYEFKQRSEKFTDWLTKNQREKAWFDLGVEMRGRFDAEERDYVWAGAEESRIQSLFTHKEALAGIAVKSTNCKTTQCEITISVLNQDHANEMAMTITQVLGAEKYSQIIIDNQAQQGESTFYVARGEKGFEFN